MTRPTRALSFPANAGFLFFLMSVVPVFAQPAFQLNEAVLVAKAIVQWIGQGNVARATQEFSEQARLKLSQEKLEEVWRGLIQSVGAYEGTEGVRIQQAAGQPLVIVICRFERAKIYAKVAFDADGKVAGLWFLPEAASDQVLAQKEEAAPLSALPPDGFSGMRRTLHEVDLQVVNGPWILPATLTLPAGAGPFAGVVLVHGTGPHDRDETIGPNKPFRDLALGLAALGVAVLRYEKRTQVHAAEMAGTKASLTVMEETVDDAVAALALLRRTEGIDPDRIFLAGHSFGGMMAPRIAALDQGLAGAIILAGNTRPLEDLIVDQKKYLALLDGTVTAAEQIQLDQLALHAARAKNPEAVNANDPPPFGVPLSYWRDLRSYHPVESAARLAIPLLILQGERDYQVTLLDFSGWKKGLAGRLQTTFKSYPRLNHLFIQAEGKSSPQEYEKPGHVSPEVIADIARWINDRLPAVIARKAY